MVDDEDFSRPEIHYILKSARTGRATVAVNTRENPIAYYHSRGWISDTQRDAGEIFRDVYEGAAIGKTAINWETIYGVSAKEDLRPAQAEHLHELRRLCRATSKVSRTLLMAVCAEGRAITEIEKQAGWRPRYGIERLREALDEVAEARGLIVRKTGSWN